jgi:hypothetical protein
MRDKEDLRLPGAGAAKLPLLPLPGNGEVPEELRRAWTEYMVEGFRQNRVMFDETLRGFTRPYWLTVWFYGVMFVVGIGLFVAAAVLGLSGGDSVVAIAFGGLSVATFLAFFVQRPLQALEENLQFITLLGVAFNTYWAQLMYLQDPATVVADLRAADAYFRSSVERLVEQHANLRRKRPGTAPESSQ